MPVKNKITMVRTTFKSQTERGKRKLYDRTFKIFMTACRAFARGLAEEVGKHIDTGMSFASILPFARFVRAAEVDMMSSNSLPKLGLTDIMGVYHPKRYKSVREGLSAGKKAFGVNTGSISIPRFSMWFSIQVYQYMIHEYGYQTAAWNSQVKAERAFMEVLYNYLARAVSGRRALIRLEDFTDIKYEKIVS